MTAAESAIDLTKIKFPTDKLTVKMLREAFPEGFDVQPPPGAVPYSNLKRPLRRHSLDSVLAFVIDCERIFADMAFKSALGQSVQDHHTQGDRETIIENLTADYVTFGVARGEHEALQMLRDIEAQAVAQARQHSGPPR